MDPFGDNNVLTLSSSPEYAQIQLYSIGKMYERPKFACIYVMSDGSEAKLMTMECCVQERPPVVFDITLTDMSDIFKCKNVQQQECSEGSENSIYRSSLLSKDGYHLSLLSVTPDNNYENERIELL